MLHEFGEISPWAILSDDVAIVGCEEGVVILQHVGVVHFLETLNFGVQHGSRGMVLKGFEFDDLDGYFFSCEIVEALVDFGGISFSYLLAEEKRVVLYFLSHLVLQVHG